MIFSFFEQDELCRYQCLNKWFYNVAISRVQTRLRLKQLEKELIFYDFALPSKLLRLQVPSYTLYSSALPAGVSIDTGSKLLQF